MTRTRRKGEALQARRRCEDLDCILSPKSPLSFDSARDQKDTAYDKNCEAVKHGG